MYPLIVASNLELGVPAEMVRLSGQYMEMWLITGSRYNSNMERETRRHSLSRARDPRYEVNLSKVRSSVATATGTCTRRVPEIFQVQTADQLGLKLKLHLRLSRDLGQVSIFVLAK